MTKPRALLAGAIASFAAGFGALATLQHRAFETGRFDVGNLTQAVWSTAHGDVLEMTDLAGRQISRLGAHFDPLVAALAPLWWLWPDPSLLLVIQAIVVAFGAVPVFRLAERHLGSPAAGTGFALAYLLYPPTQWLVLDDFHPVAMATPLLLFALDYLDQDRLVAFAIAGGLACLSKEHVGLAVAALGVWYALARRRRAAGAVIVVTGTALAVAATTVIVPHFAPGGGSPFAGRYAAVGGGPGGMLETAVTDPTRILAEAFEGRDLGYLVDLLAPLVGLPLLAPLTALIALPELAANMLSGTLTQTSIHFHYTAAAIPGLLGAAIFGAARLQRRFALSPTLVPKLVVVAAIAAGIAYGPLPLWSHVPFGEDLAARDHVVSAHDRTAARAVRLVPNGVAVSATNTLGAHLSERRRVFSFPVLREAEWVLVDTRRLSYRDAAVAPERGARALQALRADPAWRVVFSSDGILVFRRNS